MDGIDLFTAHSVSYSEDASLLQQRRQMRYQQFRIRKMRQSIIYNDTVKQLSKICFRSISADDLYFFLLI